jgi:hypothetical protein
MIRTAKDADIPYLIKMAREFWSHTIYSDEEFKADMVEGMLKACMEQNLCLVSTVNDLPIGFVCGIKGPLLANNDVLTGTELAWWLDSNHRNGGAGLSLLRGIEKRAKEEGIKYWNMAHMQASMPGSIVRIYKAMGYKLNESLYTKVM